MSALNHFGAVPSFDYQSTPTGKKIVTISTAARYHSQEAVTALKAYMDSLTTLPCLQCGTPGVPMDLYEGWLSDRLHWELRL